jgi:hypothetical protein
MLAKLNVYPNLAVALVLAVLAFRLGGVKLDWEYHAPATAQEQQSDCARIAR